MEFIAMRELEADPSKALEEGRREGGIDLETMKRMMECGE